MRRVSKGSTLAGGLSGAVVLLALVAGPRPAAADPSPLPVAVISNYGESDTARSAGMGGALRAMGSGSAGIFLNPAAMAETPAYHLEGLTDYTFETRRWMLGAVVVDSVTSRLAGSFSIQGTPITMDPDGINRSQLDLRLGIAYPLTDKFILGVSARYFKATQSGLAGPSYGFGNSVVSGGLYDPTSGTPPTSRDALVNTFTFDVGLIAKPTDALYIGLVGQNLTYANNGFLPLLVGGAFGYGANGFSIEADGLADLSSWSLPGALKPTARIMAGAEYMIQERRPGAPRLSLRSGRQAEHALARVGLRRPAVRGRGRDQADRLQPRGDVHLPERRLLHRVDRAHQADVRQRARPPMS